MEDDKKEFITWLIIFFLFISLFLVGAYAYSLEKTVNSKINACNTFWQEQFKEKCSYINYKNFSYVLEIR